MGLIWTYPGANSGLLRFLTSMRLNKNFCFTSFFFFPLPILAFLW